MASDKVVIVNFAEETNPLTILAVGIRHMRFYGYTAHFGFGEVADGKHQVADLFVGYPRKKIGLVLYRVDSGSQPRLAVDNVGGGVVACSRLVKFMPPPLFEETELDHFVAHNVGIGRKPFAHCA